MNNHASSSISSSSYTSKLFGIPTNSGAVVRALVSNKINIFAFRLRFFLLTIDAVSSSDCECDIRAAFFLWCLECNTQTLEEKSEKFIRWISNIDNVAVRNKYTVAHLCILKLSFAFDAARVPRRLFFVEFQIGTSIINSKLFFVSLSRHPLFSLLALLLEKCEQATQGYIPSASSSNSSSASSPNGSTNNSENDSFSRDIQVSCATDTFSTPPIKLTSYFCRHLYS